MAFTLEQRLVDQNEVVHAKELTHPDTIEQLYLVLRLITDRIYPGERIWVTVPKNHSHDTNGEYCDITMKEVNNAIRNSSIRKNVFTTLRYIGYPCSDVVADICCISLK